MRLRAEVLTGSNQNRTSVLKFAAPAILLHRTTKIVDTEGRVDRFVKRYSKQQGKPLPPVNGDRIQIFETWQSNCQVFFAVMI